MARFKADLETATGISITDDDLAASMPCSPDPLTHLSFIHDFIPGIPGLIRGSDERPDQGAMIMDRDEAVTLLADGCVAPAHARAGHARQAGGPCRVGLVTPGSV